MVIQGNQRGYASTSTMKSNKMYFPCCRSKSASHENLHDDSGSTPRVRRPNPIIVGLANHLREHHSSARNSAVAGCFGFPDSPPKYEDIYVEARTSGTVTSLMRHHQRDGICNVDGKTIMAEERMTPEDSIDDIPPPSYEESVGMSGSTRNCVVVTITIEKDNLKSNFT